MLKLNLSLQKKIITEIVQMELQELMRQQLQKMEVKVVIVIELMQFKLNMETGQEISTQTFLWRNKLVAQQDIQPIQAIGLQQAWGMESTFCTIMLEV